MKKKNQKYVEVLEEKEYVECQKKSKKSKKLRGRVFIVKKLLTNVRYIHTRAKIVAIKKKKDMVIVTKTSKQWVKRVTKVNSHLRSIVLNIAFAKIYQNKRVYNFVERTLTKMKLSKKNKLKEMLKKKIGRKVIIRGIIIKKFGRRLRREVRKILRSKVVRELERTQYKPTVTTKSYPTKETKEAVKLPKAILKLPSAEIKKLLELRASSKK